MESLIEKLDSFERSKETYSHKELARLKFDEISPLDIDNLEKVIRSLRFSPLVYERDINERLSEWLVYSHIEEKEQGYLFISGLLSEKHQFTILSNRPTDMEELLHDDMKEYLISKSIYYLDIRSLNFLHIYAYSKQPIFKAFYWKEVVEQKTINPQSSSFITQYIPPDAIKLDDYLDFNTRQKEGNLENTYELSIRLLSIILQILYSLGSLYVNKYNKLRFDDLSLNDIILAKTDLNEINYPGFGRVRIVEYLAIVNNYKDNCSGRISIGNTQYNLPSKKNKIIKKNVFTAFINNILKKIKNSKYLEDNLFNKLKDLDFDNVEFNKIGKTIKKWLHSLNFYKDVYSIQLDEPTIITKSIPLIYPIYSDSYMDIRKLYSGATVDKKATDSLNLRINKHYEIAEEIVSMEIEYERFLTNALINLDTFNSMWRIANRLLPESEGTESIKSFILLNWPPQAEDEPKLRKVLGKRLFTEVKDLILTFDE